VLNGNFIRRTGGLVIGGITCDIAANETSPTDSLLRPYILFPISQSLGGRPAIRETGQHGLQPKRGLCLSRPLPFRNEVILLVDANDSFGNDGMPYSSSVVTPNGVHAKLQYLYKFIECLIVCVLVLLRSSLVASFDSKFFLSSINPLSHTTLHSHNPD